MNRCKPYLRAYRIALSVVTVIAGLCLMAACLGIYTSGGQQVYTPEKVSQAFSYIALPVYLCLILMLGSAVLAVIFPQPEASAAGLQPEMLRQRLANRVDLSLCEESLARQILALRKQRQRNRGVSIGLLLLCSVLFLAYALSPHRFPSSGINAAIGKAVAVLLASLMIPFCFSLWAARQAKRSTAREIALLKSVPEKTKVTAAPQPPSGKTVTAARWVILGAAVVILIYGFLAGGTADVLTKAVNICTECVGLG